MATASVRRSVLPGFKLTMGFTIFYLSLIVLVPLLTLPARTATMTWDAFWQTITDERVVASYRLSIGASLIAAAINAVFGLIVAWVLVRYPFPGRRIVEVDGIPTPDLDAFLKVVSGRPDRSAIRLRTITWNNAPEVITLKLDHHYWPTYELNRTTDGWERRDLQ